MNTWRREIDRERERMGATWGELCKTAKDRDAFRVVIGDLCSSGFQRDLSLIPHILLFMHPL